MQAIPDVQIDQEADNDALIQCVVPISALIANLESILASLENHEKHLACAMLQRCIDELTDD